MYQEKYGKLKKNWVEEEGRHLKNFGFNLLPAVINAMYIPLCKQQINKQSKIFSSFFTAQKQALKIVRGHQEDCKWASNVEDCKWTQRNEHYEY